MNAEKDVALILKALDFAAIKHRHQRRKNGDIPYINHPIGVARILWEEGGIRDATTLVAAVLHDTVEDTQTTVEELKREFGEKIAAIVREVSDDKTLPKAERKRLQIEHAKKLSTEARLVKLGDKLYNLRDLAVKPPPTWRRERIQGYFAWAYQVVQAAGKVNTGLCARLDELFASEFTFDGKSYLVLPRDEERRKALLEEYYGQMAQTDD
jgi:(p)ppGpp synthase/HD superfamily hydrolase